MKNSKTGQIIVILAGILLASLSGCNKNNGDCCTIVDVDVQIHYQTQSGENLLNSSDEFDESKIKIYYKNGDDFEYIIRGNLDYPNMHFLYEDSDSNLILTVFPSNFYVADFSTTLIELNENVTDTLVCEFELDSNKEVCKRAWLNGVEMDNRFLEVKR
jgi:hypothetical protein